MYASNRVPFADDYCMGLPSTSIQQGQAYGAAPQTFTGPVPTGNNKPFSGRLSYVGRKDPEPISIPAPLPADQSEGGGRRIRLLKDPPEPTLLTRPNLAEFDRYAGHTSYSMPPGDPLSSRDSSFSVENSPVVATYKPTHSGYAEPIHRQSSGDLSPVVTNSSVNGRRLGPRNYDDALYRVSDYERQPISANFRRPFHPDRWIRNESLDIPDPRRARYGAYETETAPSTYYPDGARMPLSARSTSLYGRPYGNYSADEDPRPFLKRRSGDFDDGGYRGRGAYNAYDEDMETEPLQHRRTYASEYYDTHQKSGPEVPYGNKRPVESLESLLNKVEKLKQSSLNKFYDHEKEEPIKEDRRRNEPPSRPPRPLRFVTESEDQNEEPEKKEPTKCCFISQLPVCDLSGQMLLNEESTQIALNNHFSKCLPKAQDNEANKADPENCYKSHNLVFDQPKNLLVFDKCYETAIWDYDPRFEADYMPGTKRGLDERMIFVYNESYQEEENKWRRYANVLETINRKKVNEKIKQVSAMNSDSSAPKNFEIPTKDLKILPGDSGETKGIKLGALFEAKFEFPDELITEDYCGMCDNAFTNIMASISHYNSMRHNNAVFEYFCNEALEIGDLTKMENQLWFDNAVRGIIKKHKIKPTEWKCDLCEVLLTSEAHAQSHFSGIYHKRRATSGLSGLQEIVDAEVMERQSMPSTVEQQTKLRTLPKNPKPAADSSYIGRSNSAYYGY